MAASPSEAERGRRLCGSRVAAAMVREVPASRWRRCHRYGVRCPAGRRRSRSCCPIGLVASAAVTDREARAVSTHSSRFPRTGLDGTTPAYTGRTFSQQRGHYEIDELPISSYRVVAVTSLPRNAWTDPEVVARLWPFTTVSLDELRESTLHLKVVPPPTDLLQ